MSNSEVNDSTMTINWTVEAAAPLSSWADEMDELDAVESPTPSSPTLTYDDTQLPESSITSSSSSDNEEEGKSSPRDRSDQNERSPLDHTARPFMPRRGSTSRRELRDSSSDLSSVPKTSVKEEVPFPTVAPFVAFITNLSLTASRDDISKLMEPIAGVPKSIKIILEKETGRPRGFCYVEFEDATGLKAAIDADGIELLSQPLHIVVAEKKPTPQSRSNGHSRRETSLRRSSDDYQERRQPRMDSASSSSKGKFDNQSSMKTRKDDFRFQNQRSNSFSQDKRSFKPSGPAGRERYSPVKKDTKSDERSMSVGNMFSALRLSDDM